MADDTPLAGLPPWARAGVTLVAAVGVLSVALIPFAGRLAVPGARPHHANAWTAVRPEAYAYELELTAGVHEAHASVVVGGRIPVVDITRCTLDDCEPWVDRFVPYERLLQTIAPEPWTATGSVPLLTATYDIPGSNGEEQRVVVTRFEVLVGTVTGDG